MDTATAFQWQHLPQQQRILIVDDLEPNRDLLASRVQRLGHTTGSAANGREALQELQEHAYDLVLLDIMMPEMNGFEVLETMQQSPTLARIPVIVVSALTDIDSVVRCIELGAEDYLFKPINPTLLKARLNTSLEKKYLRDLEAFALAQTERLLLNTLPQAIIERLRQGEQTIADTYDDVTVMFIDLVGFTSLVQGLSAHEVVELLNRLFQQFDLLIDQYQLEKIKTIGDSYMIVGGAPVAHADHTLAMAQLALDMQAHLQTYTVNQQPLNARIGIHCGSVVAGVIGQRKFTYDIWGTTVNIASRMESQGQTGAIQVSQAVYARLKDRFVFSAGHELPVRGVGSMSAYYLLEARG